MQGQQSSCGGLRGSRKGCPFRGCAQIYLGTRRDRKLLVLDVSVDEVWVAEDDVLLVAVIDEEVAVRLVVVMLVVVTLVVVVED